MGIFDKIFGKKKEENNSNNMPKQYAMPSKDQVSEILMYGITNQGPIRHRNQSITELIMARITKQQRDTIYFDMSDYIAFELTVGDEINDEVMQSVMEQYDNASNQEQKTPRIYYLGRLQEGDRGYEFGRKSEAVEKIVQNIVGKQEAVRREQVKNSIRQREQREVAFRAQAAQSANQYMEKMNKIRQERIANPSIEKLGDYQIVDKVYTDYDGINVSTGDILRMRKVDKVGKDGSGTYLYTAYLQSTPNKDDVELFDKEEPAGYPVCFTLGKRLADIVQEGNIQEINTLLTLLSTPENFQDRSRLAYIGGINKEGVTIQPYFGQQYDFSQNGTRRIDTAIEKKIDAMQKEYMEKMQEERGK